MFSLNQIGNGDENVVKLLFLNWSVIKLNVSEFLSLISYIFCIHWKFEDDIINTFKERGHFQGMSTNIICHLYYIC